MLVAISLPFALFGPLGGTELVLVAIIAILLFGKDLPEVARTWGKYLTEFRRHVNGLKSELNDAMYADETPRLQYHPQFHNRDPLPEAIPAETSGYEGNEADQAGVDTVSIPPQPAQPLPSEAAETVTFRSPVDDALPRD